MGLLPCGSRVVRVVLYAVLLVATLAPWATGQGSTQILVITGDVAPQASDMFTGLSIPALNNAGQVSFHASLTGAASKNEGIYRAGGPGPRFIHFAKCLSQAGLLMERSGHQIDGGGCVKSKKIRGHSGPKPKNRQRRKVKRVAAPAERPGNALQTLQI